MKEIGICQNKSITFLKYKYTTNFKDVGSEVPKDESRPQKGK